MRLDSTEQRAWPDLSSLPYVPTAHDHRETLAGRQGATSPAGLDLTSKTARLVRHAPRQRASLEHMHQIARTWRIASASTARFQLETTHG